MSKRKSLKNGSTNSENLREVVKIIDSARKRLSNNPRAPKTVSLDLISAAIKLNTIIKTSKK
jgi:hypothetical protein